jgi:hypothetical protein
MNLIKNIPTYSKESLDSNGKKYSLKRDPNIEQYINEKIITDLDQQYTTKKTSSTEVSLNNSKHLSYLTLGLEGINKTRNAALTIFESSVVSIV